jgi:pimeloyl-ACP methyl ester carboxylesterase
MAEFDAPAMLDFILDSTGREKLTYIGHSTGNTQMFYNFTRPNKKFFTSRVNLFVALAPVTRVQNIKPWFFRWLASETDWIKWATDTIGWYEIFGFYSNEWSRLICGVTPSVCTNLEGMVLTSDPKYEDPDRFEVYMGHIPGGTSLKAYEHVS